MSGYIRNNLISTAVHILCKWYIKHQLSHQSGDSISTRVGNQLRRVVILSEWQLNQQSNQFRCNDRHKYKCVMVATPFMVFSIRPTIYEFSLLMRCHAHN